MTWRYVCHAFVSLATIERKTLSKTKDLVKLGDLLAETCVSVVKYYLELRKGT